MAKLRKTSGAEIDTDANAPKTPPNTGVAAERSTGRALIGDRRAGSASTSAPAQKNRASRANPNSTDAYDEFMKQRSEKREVKGGESVVASGFHRGRSVKEDGSIDYDTPSLLEKRVPSERNVENVSENSVRSAEDPPEPQNQSGE